MITYNHNNETWVNEVAPDHTLLLYHLYRLFKNRDPPNSNMHGIPSKIANYFFESVQAKIIHNALWISKAYKKIGSFGHSNEVWY